VVFPAAGLAVASGGAEQASSFFVRVYETVSLHLHDRTANSLVRAQAIVDTVTAGKMAAAAASAAALAGGGVAVEGVLTSANPSTPAAIMRRAENRVATAFVKQPAKHASRTKAQSKPKREKKPARVTAPRRSTTASAAPRQPPAQQPQAPATTGTRTAAAATGSAGGSGASASSEFGFEGP
jgi:hypothetical protein